MTKTHILCAVDLTDRCDKAIAVSIELAKCYGAKLTLVHIIEPLMIPHSIYPDIDKLQLLLEKDAKEKLAAIAAKYQLKQEQILIKSGNSKIEILNIADELQVGLIVVCDPGHYGIRHQLTGSTTRVIVNSSSCDVYVVR